MFKEGGGGGTDGCPAGALGLKTFPPLPPRMLAFERLLEGSFAEMEM